MSEYANHWISELVAETTSTLEWLLKCACFARLCIPREHIALQRQQQISNALWVFGRNSTKHKQLMLVSMGNQSTITLSIHESNDNKYEQARHAINTNVDRHEVTLNVVILTETWIIWICLLLQTTKQKNAKSNA